MGKTSLIHVATMIKNILLSFTSIGALISAYLILIEPSIEVGREERTQRDLESILEYALDVEKATGDFPNSTDMEKYLVNGAKDVYGYRYIYELIDQVVVIRSTGKDGKLGGFGKNRDQVLIHKST
ncbi:hypothetical protein TDB9533_04803 [Thalassocella blandensis]|nr:hypothetical protein TDB9533_04803 [Thalassocella blandensis]